MAAVESLESKGEALIKLRQSMIMAKLAFKIARDNLVNDMMLAKESTVQTELGNILVFDVDTTRFETKRFKREQLALYLKYSRDKTVTKVKFEGCDEDEESEED